MANPMRNTDFRSIVEPIMNEAFDGIYDQRKDEYKDFMKVEAGTARDRHEEPVLSGFGSAPELPDGMPVTYSAGGVLYIKQYIYRQYGLAFAMTKILIEDGDHVRIGQIYSRHLAQSMVETKETLTANVLNRAFNGSYVGGDGVALCVSTHPMVNGTWSNVLATAAALSQTSVEQMLIQIYSATDNSGKKIHLDANKLIVSPQNAFQGETILKSVLRTGTANNDVNPIISRGMLGGGCKVVTRLTSTTAWFVKMDNVQAGLKLLTRRKLTKSMEGDFETDSMRYKCTERYREGWTDPRDIYGTAGV